MACELRRVFETEDFSLNNKNILSRNTSVGTCSSRIYYYRSAAEGIPFQWEMQPGTPKNLPSEEAIPPITPPPAVLSLGFPKPCINEEPPVKPRFKVRLIRFWIKKSKKSNFHAKKEDQNNVKLCSHSCKDERLEFGSSDGEFMASPARDSSSSSLSSLSFSVGFSRQSSRLESPAWNPRNRSTTLSCSPWNIRSFVKSLAKRV